MLVVNPCEIILIDGAVRLVAREHGLRHLGEFWPHASESCTGSVLV